MYSMECTYLCTLHNRLQPTCICISYLNLCICVWSIAMYLMECIYILYWFCTLHIMEWSPAVFSFHPICSPQIDLSTPSNQCGINCMKSHLHTYTSPSPTQPHTTSTCISSPTPDPWKTHKAHTDEVVPIDPRVVSSSILQPLANIQYNIPPISCIILNISRYSKNSICMVSA